MSTPVLEVRNLHVHYFTDRVLPAVNGVDFTLRAGERMGLVGESGSGKSTMALALMRMIKPPGRIVSGEMLVDGVDLTRLNEEQMRKARATQISMIPQGAMNSLNPVMRIGDQIVDTIQAHSRDRSSDALEKRVYEALESVGLKRGVARMYPHELSGGMKQRVCIAIAVALRPKVIIADEPTSALDVVVQRQVMETIGRLQEEMGLAIILIGHDMGLMAQFVDHLAVMYSGKLAELSPVRQIFDAPLHPYTQLLIDSLPRLEQKGTFKGIPGLPPSLTAVPPGCVFNPRCPYVMDRCRTVIPEYREAREDRWVACHLHEVEQ
ncbi:MAG TPA: ABC transporter ATP-binding protein [Herpetosiphonaceae bacterium]|nr:ABC transporter ATP-binding protein [Herpetosiphonaceae bacterium]